MGDRRDAFADRREQMGYTQESFGLAVGVEFSTVGRWERGDLTPHPYRRSRIAKALNVSLAELGALLTPPRQAPTVDVVHPHPAEADDMNRRDLLRLFSVTGALLALPADEAVAGDVDRLTAAAYTGRVDAASAAEFAQFNSHLWRVFALSTTKAQVLPLVRTQLDVLTDSLRRPQTPGVRRQLCELTADLYQLAGEISFDGDQYTEAAHCYTLAATASREATASDLWACALTRHAFIAVYERRFAEAKPLLELASSLARRGDPALSTRQWIAAVQAETFAGLGDLDACQRALDTAAEVQHMKGPIHNGGWLRFDGSRLAEERGTCYVTLGRYDLAETALTGALTGDLTARRKAGVLTDLAMIGVHRRDPDRVATYVNAALATARHTGSGVIARKLRGLQPNLAPLLTHQPIQQLDVEITELVGNRAT
ncbi:multiprotein-bridging factor 1 family protein [Amycolatopsis umgeniensis]|uniref:Transcriptional regulator with XRE-family HTH domain n=1 Tax=Amycolatopsis umgeniensis TaxID=336628 RepID=A0A841B8M1_9PSEU|nr:helix-turn-helix domain-containing protein [Amycolatopsis umgeniensis]MBB5856386.1 transcriptional regulator with XRE-family HTH domain [Amycolatopsis umgeniensis]